jgi:putative nucleotidyltransferase with HDIG domain
VDDISRGALLHDIGKMAIPDAILMKPGRLTEEEWKVVKNHPKTGYDILKSSPFLQRAAEIVYSHQEKYDGSGYPRGLCGTGICLGGRIFAVVDAYDAMRTGRIYSKIVAVDQAVEEIKNKRGTQFDPDVVNALLCCLPKIEAVGQWKSLKPQTVPNAIKPSDCRSGRNTVRLRSHRPCKGRSRASRTGPWSSVCHPRLLDE